MSAGDSLLRRGARLGAAFWLLSAALPAATRAQVAADSSQAAAPDDERGVLNRLTHGTENLLSDAWYVVSSPARLNARSAMATAVVLGTAGVLYAYDQEISDAVWRNRDNPTFSALMDFAYSYEPLGFMPRAFQVEAGVGVVGYALGMEPLQQIAVECIESHLISGGIRNVLKYVVGRAHPYEDLGPRHFVVGEGTSFPSGHTAVFFEIATVLSEHADSAPVTAALYACAALGAVQRVESENHWASDVLTPAVTGTLIARTVVGRNAARRERERAGPAAAAEPGWKPMVMVGHGVMKVGVTRAFGPARR